MNTSEINLCLRDLNQFIGTFPCNLIRRSTLRPAAYIINTAKLDAQSKADKDGVVKGKHWVAIIMLPAGRAVYFDSFGMPPTESEILKFITENSKNGYTYSTKMLQRPLSVVCGAYCVDFVRHFLQGMRMEKYLSQFTSDLALNDQLVVKRVTCQLSAQQQCSP